MPAVERAVFDLAAGVIGHDLAAAETAANGCALAWERFAQPTPAGDDEIRRPTIERRGELAGRHARALDDRLVIAGEEAVGIADPVDADGTEIVLEEFFRAGLIERDGFAGAAANFPQRRRDGR